jgi:hypothetical protein
VSRTSKYILFFLLFHTFEGFAAQPSSKQKAKKVSEFVYKSYPMIVHGKKFVYPKQIKVSGEKLNIKIHPKMGTHYLLGIDQLYVSKNLKKKILVKQDVMPSSQKVLKNWVKLSSGSVYHYIKNKKVVAIYVEGYSDRALGEIEKQFVSLKQRKFGQLLNVNHSSTLAFNLLFFKCAYAEVGTSRASENLELQGLYDEQETLEADRALRIRQYQESLANCLLRQTGSGFGSMGRSAAGSLGTAARTLREDPLGAAQTTGRFLYGAVETAYNTYSRVMNPLGPAVDYCINNNCLDMGQVWSDAGDAVDSMYQLGGHLNSQLSNAVDGFSQLEPVVRNQLICEIGGQLIAEFGVAAVLTYFGGAAVASPRMALVLGRIEQKLQRGLVALSALGRSGFSVDDQQRLVTEFISNQISEEQLLSRINSNSGFAAANLTNPGVNGAARSPVGNSVLSILNELGNESDLLDPETLVGQFRLSYLNRENFPVEQRYGAAYVEGRFEDLQILGQNPDGSLRVNILSNTLAEPVRNTDGNLIQPLSPPPIANVATRNLNASEITTYDPNPEIRNRVLGMLSGMQGQRDSIRYNGQSRSGVLQGPNSRGLFSILSETETGTIRYTDLSLESMDLSSLMILND